MTRVLAFDVNETLLDLGPLDPLFEQALGSAALRQTWFSQMLQVAFVGGLTGRYVDFSSAGRAALAMIAAAQGLSSRRAPPSGSSVRSAASRPTPTPSPHSHG